MSRAGVVLPFALLCCLIFALENLPIALSIVGAMTVHELGHIIAIHMCGGRVSGVLSSSVGANLICSLDRHSLRRDVLIFISGPCAGAVAGMAGYFCGLYEFAWISMYLTVLNLLPAVPFDGGCILKTVLPCGSAEKILTVSSIITGLVLCIVGLYFIAGGYNFTVFASGIGVFLSMAGKSSLQ